ncbi:hypothetical protein KY285_005435 [Solanum tuberosum]|nr:hypothetical protein KY284_005646 [Solanum tuberosum]KAH0752287.1 hypothetical protein KY285_005435 [Solanum tuberosum]
MAANQDLVAMITELYNNVGGPVGYNNYCITMGMLETIKAKLSLEMFGNVVMEQQQQPAPNVVPVPNVVMEQQQQQQQPPAPVVAQNVVLPAQVPVLNLDALSEAARDDWRPFDGQTFDFVSNAPLFWFNIRLTTYMISSCRIQLHNFEMQPLRNGSPQHSFVHSINWRDRSLPVTLLSSRLPAPPTPGLIFSHEEPNCFFLYWPGVTKHFRANESISVTYQWARSRSNGRFLLVLTIEQDSFPPQPPLNRERRTRVTRTGPQDRGETSAAGASRAIGGASGSTGPRERGETSAAGASRARHETSARGSLGNQLRSTRVLRSATRG